MATSAVRDLKNTYPEYRIKVDTNNKAIWDNNPYVEDFDGYDEKHGFGAKIVTQSSRTNGQHFTTAFRVCLEDALKKPIKQGLLKPEIYLDEFEKKSKLICGKYWVINIDCGPYSAKRWIHERWQEVVSRLNHITFVQVGLTKDNTYRLKGQNVIDFVGKTQDYDTGLRRLFQLVYHSEGCISLISSLMHIAAAFDKPCVVIAGAREPITFEGYQNHRFLHTIGSLKCSSTYACWACSMEGCLKRKGEVIDGVCRCIHMITADDVVNAILSYYKGGLLETSVRLAMLETHKKPIFKVVTNGKTLGGAERSVVEIVKMAILRGYDVEVATRKGIVCKSLREELKHVKFTNNITSACDVLLIYASDMVFDFDKPEFDVFKKVNAKRKVMALTYKIGSSGKADWSKDWDSYLFLSSTMKDQFRKIVPDAKCEVLAPPVDLEKFFKVKPDYKALTHVVRHSSQGSKKIPSDMKSIEEACKAKFSLMTNYEMPVEEFLAKGNCFWYLLPDGYTDQGPRVICEALASGLPVIAENRDGAKDRIDDKCGWLVNNHFEVIDIINSLTPEILEKKGTTARKRAKEKFSTHLWIDAIIGKQNE